MKTRINLLPVLMLLLMTAIACTPSVVENTPAPDPLVTEVAATPQATQQPVSTLLPHSLYFLGKDPQSIVQVFRRERDGKTQTQPTSEPVNILTYDVSPRDGSVVYETDNQLVFINADGSSRTVITEGAPRGNVYSFYHPVFSPDGQTLAYANGGLALYDIASGTTNFVLPDRSGDATSPRESYVPEAFSPDGTKLLVHMLHSDTSSIAIYDRTTNTLVPFEGKSDDDFACCQFGREIVWMPDSINILSTNPTPGVDAGGMWRVDIRTGEASTIVSYGGDNNTFNFVDEPFAAPDGVYYFLSNYDGNLGPLNRAPAYLEIVRIAGDGWNDRTSLLRSESLRMMNEALWAPDGSFVIVALAPSEDVRDGGQAEIVYLDGRPNVVLAPFAQELKWGP